MGLVRFLQISDFHLGRPFGWLPPDRREMRRRDQREALERAVREAIERGVHGILLAGDLFDEEGVDADTLAFAIGTFQIPGCPRVFIAPGNHDPCSPQSLFWNPRLLKARGRQWPDHVHVFADSRWAAAPPMAEGARVWGRCYISKVSVAERPLSKDWLRGVMIGEGPPVNVAVFHGSREGHVPAGQTSISPFSDDEATESPFTYLAVGHYHAAGRMASQGTVAGVRMAYAGSAVALDANETGAHGALEVRIEHGHRQPFVETEFVPLDRRRVHVLPVDVTGCTSAERVDRKIERALDDVSAGEDDIVTVQLAGRLARDVRYEPSRELAARVFHMRLDRRALRPDYPLERYRESTGSTTDERFARALLQRLDAASNPEEKARLERALYHGLDAFQLKEVIPVHEDLEP